MYNAKKDFTIEDAIQIQEQQLLEMEKYTIKSFVDRLRLHCKEKNEGAKRTDDIIRGTTMSNDFHNYIVNGNKYL